MSLEKKRNKEDFKWLIESLCKSKKVVLDDYSTTLLKHYFYDPEIKFVAFDGLPKETIYCKLIVIDLPHNSTNWVVSPMFGYFSPTHLVILKESIMEKLIDVSQSVIAYKACTPSDQNSFLGMKPDWVINKLINLNLKCPYDVFYRILKPRLMAMGFYHVDSYIHMLAKNILFGYTLPMIEGFPSVTRPTLYLCIIYKEQKITEISAYYYPSIKTFKEVSKNGEIPINKDTIIGYKRSYSHPIFLQ